MKSALMAGLFVSAACLAFLGTACITEPANQAMPQPSPSPSPVATSAPVTPSPAPAALNPVLIVSPTTGPAGTPFSLNISGFTPGSWAPFTVSKDSIGQLISEGITINNMGVGRISIASDRFTPGVYLCSVEEPSLRRLIPASFTVTAPPITPAALTVTPLSAAPGTPVVISGKGFSPRTGAGYSIFYGNERSVKDFGSAAIGAEGQFALTLNTTGYEPGTYAVEFQDGATMQTASASFDLALIKPQSWLPIKDSLNIPAGNWKATARPGVNTSGSYESGGFALTLTTEDSLAWISNPAIQPIADFTVEVEGRALPDAYDRMYYGLIFRFVDLNNHYLFLIDPNTGNWAIKQRLNGVNTDIIDWVASVNSGIGPNPNHFKIVCSGLNIKAYLNGRLMATSNDATLGPGLVAPVISKLPYTPAGPVRALFTGFNLGLPPGSP